MEDIERIYREYYKDVYLYILAISKNTDIAEEITAETFFKSIKAIRKFKGECHVRVWLCQIAKNTYFNFIRKSSRITSSDSYIEKGYEIDHVSDIDNHDKVKAILSYIDGFDCIINRVVILRLVYELSFKEIASVLNKNENWACVTYHRAIKQIRKEFKNE